MDSVEGVQCLQLQILKAETKHTRKGEMAELW